MSLITAHTLATRYGAQASKVSEDNRTAPNIFYRGHHIQVCLSEHTFGDWHWTYSIDGQGPYGSHGRSFVKRDLALQDALRCAKARIRRSRATTPPAEKDSQ